MSTWIWILGSLYGALLVAVAWYAWRRNRDEDAYILAGSNVGALLGLLTYAATLFSTFTLMGMPDFFRTHGVGAWIFLAVSDGAQVFLIVWFGVHIRRRARQEGFKGTAGLLGALYRNRWAGYVYFAGIFLFLVPYVAIQIRGLAIFLEAAFPGAVSAWIWSTAIVAVMLTYSEIGGLRAIMYSDVIQGLTLLTVVWIVAIGFLDTMGGMEALFEEVRTTNEALLSTPGPHGLFTVQFLIASFFGVVLLPATQPQLTTRLIVLKDRRALNRMAVAVGCFALLILFPVAVIGMYGAVAHPVAETRDFLSSVLLFEQPGILAAAAVIGLLTAAMSTADSQIFALGTELRSLMRGPTRVVLPRTKWAVVAFGVAALVFSVVSSDQLVLLARVSFNGTALVGPMVLAGVLMKRSPGMHVVAATAVALLVFLLSLVGLVPEMAGPIRLDLLLLLLLGIVTATSAFLRHTKDTMVNVQQ